MGFDIMTDKRLTLEEGSEIIEDAILHKKPLSLVRIGEGEATFLQDVSLWTEKLLSWRQEYYFGTDNISKQHWFQLCKDIKKACINSDFLCCPAPERIHAVCQDGGHFADRYRDIPQLCADIDFSQNTKLLGNAYIPYGFHNSGKIFQWMEMATNIVIITSQPIINNLKLLFPDKVEQIKVPPRAVDNEKIKDTKHFPDGYYSIIEQISHIKLGSLVLIGAGPCGKVYCDKVKQAGSIAIDIGALFDAWCNHKTRPNMELIDGFFEYHGLKGGVTVKSGTFCSPFLLTTDNIYQSTGGKVDKRGVDLQKILPKISPCLKHDRVLLNKNYSITAELLQNAGKNQCMGKPNQEQDYQCYNERQSLIEQELEAVYNSLSWKITVPLRKVLGILKGE